MVEEGGSVLPVIDRNVVVEQLCSIGNEKRFLVKLRTINNSKIVFDRCKIIFDS